MLLQVFLICCWPYRYWRPDLALIHDAACIHAVAGVSSVVGPTLTGGHALAFTHALAGTHGMLLPVFLLLLALMLLPSLHNECYRCMIFCCCFFSRAHARNVFRALEGDILHYTP